MKITQALTARLKKVKERYRDAVLKIALDRRHRRAIPEMPEDDGLFNALMDHVRFGVLVIPDWMTKIGKRLFDGDDIIDCHGKARSKSAMTNRIHAVVIPGSVKTIEERAFAKCKNLKRVILEEGIEVIEDTAFTGCKELTEVRLPVSLHDVSGDAFSNCGLKAPVFSGDGKVLVWYPQVSPTKEYAVPEGVEEIGRCAFHNAIQLSKIILPQSLKRIRSSAFIACSFPIIEIPEGVTIEEKSFLCFRYPLEIRQGAPLDRMTECRVRGIAVLNRCSIKPPLEKYWQEEEFQILAQRCAVGDVAAMDSMGDFFHHQSERKGTAFFQCAENFWRFRAYLYGSERGKQYLDRWVAERPYERMDSPGIDERLAGTAYGETLNALGFLFFSPGTEYDLNGLDKQGVVCACVFEGEDGPDEDGFGREEYYNWWYLDKYMNLPEGGCCLGPYSFREQSYHEDSFRAMHDLAAAASSRK